MIEIELNKPEPMRPRPPASGGNSHADLSFARDLHSGNGLFLYVKQISTSSAAMIGVAEKGPINKPVLVTSWEQFINRFGT